MTSDLTVGTEMSRMRGIVPGYGGFIPASRDKYGATPYGGGPLTKVEK